MEKSLVEQEIQIASVRFAHNAEQIKFESFPRRLIYKGREYVLTES
jgi:hypothetical protein